MGAEAVTIAGATLTDCLKARAATPFCFSEALQKKTPTTINFVIFQMVDCRNSEVGSTRLKRSFDVAFLTGIDVNVKADVQDEEEDFLGANLDIKNKREGKGLVSSVSEEGIYYIVGTSESCFQNFVTGLKGEQSDSEYPRKPLKLR